MDTIVKTWRQENNERFSIVSIGSWYFVMDYLRNMILLETQSQCEARLFALRLIMESDGFIIYNNIHQGGPAIVSFVESQ